ncbi:MerR family transcriptional regulator [Sulfitobacter sp. AS92]|uniref:helix-turn-helix domain-containing protein n=1 Tax=Sulfitobacter sp. AS92 TaxID=3135783 RepID=UPI00316E329F
MSVDNMKIGDLARRAGVSQRTIHYYERLGLISPVAREGASHRLYEEEAFARLEKIAALKRLGLSLEEIQQVIDMYFADADTHLQGKQKVIDILKGQLSKVDVQLGELSEFRRDLIQNIQHMEHLYDDAVPDKRA